MSKDIKEGQYLQYFLWNFATVLNKVLELVMEIDTDGNGTIDFHEFIDMMKKKSSETDQLEVDFFKIKMLALACPVTVYSWENQLSHQDLKEAFRMFDKNNDGFIDLVELRKVTESDWKRRLSCVRP